MNILSNRPPIPRRTFLKGAGISLALPWLDAMRIGAGETPGEPIRRAVFCFFGLGLNGRDFTPAETGRNYTLTPILRPLAALKDDFTIISGLRLTHSGGHVGDRTFLTGTNTRSAGAGCASRATRSWPRRSVGRHAFHRCPSASNAALASAAITTTRFRGQPAARPSPRRIGRTFFSINSFVPIRRPRSPSAKQSSCAGPACSIRCVRKHADLKVRSAPRIGPSSTSISREFAIWNGACKTSATWLRRPKPRVDTLNFGNIQSLDPDRAGLDYRRYQRLMFDVIALALRTDGTRVISYLARMDGSDGTGAWRSLGNPYNYHEMTHHGEDPDKLLWFTRADIWYMEEWAYFLNKLKSVGEGDGTLLDHTLVAYGSSGGAINAHHNHHLPTMLAGGSRLGVRHQGHIVKEDVRLGNLWRTIFDRMNCSLPRNFQGGEADGIIRELV